MVLEIEDAVGIDGDELLDKELGGGEGVALLEKDQVGEEGGGQGLGLLFDDGVEALIGGREHGTGGY